MPEDYLQPPAWVNEGKGEGPERPVPLPSRGNGKVGPAPTTRGNVGGKISLPVRVAASLAIYMSLAVVFLYTFGL